jgi:hypothetical protein
MLTRYDIPRRAPLASPALRPPYRRRPRWEPWVVWGGGAALLAVGCVAAWHGFGLVRMLGGL